LHNFCLSFDNCGKQRKNILTFPQHMYPRVPIFRQSFNMWPALGIKPAFYHKIHLWNKTLTIGWYFKDREWKFDNFFTFVTNVFKMVCVKLVVAITGSQFRQLRHLTVCRESEGSPYPEYHQWPLSLRRWQVVLLFGYMVDI
jgi:hypothetical protein